MSDVLDRLKSALSDRYAIQRELGYGGMAVVYLAQDLRLERRVAIKVLRPELTSVVAAGRFLREIKLTANLHHPHILQLYESGEADGLLYYVMPYVEGESLGQKLSREGPLPVDDAVTIAREVADALSYAHERDLLHRDIKPENILLEAGHAVVADFGIARALSEAAGDRLTDTGVSIGTPAYMSPEQASGERELSEASDVYSLACVLYEMLTGDPPVTDSSVQKIVSRKILGDFRPVSDLRPEVSVEIDAAVSRALATEPAGRFAAASEFARALRVASQSERRDVGLARVIGLYSATSVAVLAVTYFLTLRLGLPDWVLPVAVVLLMVGTPIILATALLQAAHHSAAVTGGDAPQGRPPSGMAAVVKRWFTWRRAILGGVLAFALLGIVVGGYMAMRAMGIGPSGTLTANGVLEGRGLIVLTAFAVILLAVLAFPIARVLARAYELTGEGIRRKSPQAANATLPRLDRARFSRRTAVALLVVLLGAAGAWSLHRWRGERRAVTPTAIAVLPFAVSGSDDATYLGRGMVDLLSRTLDGAFGLRSIDPGTVLQRAGRAQRAEPLDIASATAFARSMGAGQFVIGSVSAAAGRLRIQATLHDTEEPESPLSQAAREGDARAVFDLVDGVAADLLAQRTGPASARLARSAVLATHSVEAFKAFLEAEEALRRSDYDAAFALFQEAVTEDSTFALAHYRVAVAGAWAQRWSSHQSAPGHRLLAERPERLGAAPGAIERALAHSSRLSERDRRLVEAFAAFRRGAADQAEGLYRTVLRDHPDDLEARFQLGNVLYEYNPMRGRPRAESREHFAYVMEVDPQFLCPI